MLGTGQLSLAKFLIITADPTRRLSTRNIPAFLDYILTRIDLRRDLHFLTNTTMDTLDYSGQTLNSGSKVIMAAYGEPRRELLSTLPKDLISPAGGRAMKLMLPGIVAIEAPPFITYGEAKNQLDEWTTSLGNQPCELDGLPIMVLCDDAAFTAASLNNFLWVTFTRCNPAADIYGVGAFTENKHWGCKGPLLLDARIKPHHAPPVEKNPVIEKKIDALFQKGGSLSGTLA